MSSITSIGSTTTTLPTTTTSNASSTSSTSSTGIPTSVSADLSFEAGVVATFSSPTASTDPTTELYTNLAGLSTTGTSSSIDLNQQWANALAGNANLAPLAVQMTADQTLLTAVL